MQVKSTVGGWGDGLVHKVFAMEARGPEFTSPAPTEKTKTKAKCGGVYTIIPALGQAERQADSWAHQPSSTIQPTSSSKMMNTT